MNIAGLFQALERALGGEPEPASLEQLASEAERMADMTGWAFGPIDPHGKIGDACRRLEEQAKALYLQNNDPAVARVHDAIAGLHEAIALHDLQLTPPQDDEDDYETS